MSQAEIRPVIDAWAEQYESLAAVPWVQHVQIFENCGAMMGASNPHPHCQIWANATIPNQPTKEQAAQLDYRARLGSCLLCDYLRLELGRRERVVCQNESLSVVVPYLTGLPSETLF